MTSFRGSAPPPSASSSVEPPDPPGFLRTLARPSGAATRLVVVLLACVAGLVFLPLLVLGAAIALSRLFGADYRLDASDGFGAVDMLVINLGLAALIAEAALLVRLLYGVRPRWLSSTRPGMRWKWLIVCLGIATVVWSLLLVGGTAAAVTARKAPIDAGVWSFLAVVLLTTPLQAAGEEYLFRGVLLQALGALRWPVAACCAVSAGLFAVAHLQFDPQLFADRVMLGGVLALLAVRTGGLEAGIAIHTVYNLSALVPAGFLDTAAETIDPHGVTWVPVVLHAVLLAFAYPWIVVPAGRRRLNRSRQARPPDCRGMVA